MTFVRWIIALAAVAAVLPAQAQDRAAPGGIEGVSGPLATSDPEIVIYRFPGVYDNGGAENTGTATVIHCTNFSGVTERIRFVLRNFNTTLVGNVENNVGHLGTLTKATHGTVNTEDLPHIAPGVSVNQGTLAIAATSTNIICTALVTDAATATPHGVALRGIRFNPAPGSQE
jgi:hypothetical protein